MLKKIFIKICRLLGYEIIDQNQFHSPTINQNLNNNLSTLNKKSIVLPLGKVNISRKVSSLLIIFRTNTKIKIWDQNKKRIFNKPKKEYTLRSLNSLMVSISQANKKFNNIDFKLIIVDDKSEHNTLKELNLVVNKYNIQTEIVSLDHEEYKNIIEENYKTDTYGNLCSLLKCFFLAKEKVKDLVFFVEDDYLHTESVIEEMLLTYERISSQTKRELIFCPADYPFQYMGARETSVLIGSHRHWQVINKTLCTFLTSDFIINKYWNNFILTCKKRNDPFEKHINKIYEDEYCFSPIKSLSVHLTNINSSYGISPYINIKKLWEKNS